MYVLCRSYASRVPENLKRDASSRRHLRKTEEEDYNKIKSETHDSAQTHSHAHYKFKILLLCVHTREEEDGFDEGV
jgi:hypothetical protein